MTDNNMAFFTLLALLTLISFMFLTFIIILTLTNIVVSIRHLTNTLDKKLTQVENTINCYKRTGQSVTYEIPITPLQSYV